MTQKPASISSAALDFAPGLLAIQEAPPARMPRAVMYAVTALFGILLVWGYYGKLDIIASAQGRLIPKSYVKIVQPADAGIVSAIFVSEGQKVKKGQVLIQMDPKDTEADEKTLRTEMAIRSLQLRRIAAELLGHPLAHELDDPPDLYRQVAEQFQGRRRTYLTELAQAQDALTKARRDYDAGKENLAKLKEVTPLLKKQADAYADLSRDGYAPVVMARDKEKEYVEKAKDLRAQVQTVASLSAAVAEAEKNAGEVTAKYRSNLENERIDAEEKYRKLQQDWIKEAHKAALLELRAPQAGIVKDLSTHTIGTVVSPGTVLLSLVPENEALVAEVMIKNDDVGFVHPAQKAKIKLVAYPFEKYGMLEGTVSEIGPDASDPDSRSRDNHSKMQAQDQPANILPFKAEIGLDSQSLDTQGQHLKLVAGMQVIAEINEGSRTVLEYLLSPVQKTLHDSGRER